MHNKNDIDLIFESYNRRVLEESEIDYDALFLKKHGKLPESKEEVEDFKASLKAAENDEDENSQYAPEDAPEDDQFDGMEPEVAEDEEQCADVRNYIYNQMDLLSSILKEIPEQGKMHPKAVAIEDLKRVGNNLIGLAGRVCSSEEDVV